MYRLYLSENDRKEKGEVVDFPQHVPRRNDDETQDLPRDGKPALADFVDVEQPSAATRARGIDTDHVTRPEEELVVVNQEQRVRMNSILCVDGDPRIHSSTRHRNTKRYRNDPLPGAVAVSGHGDISTTGSIQIGYGQNDIIDSERAVDAIIPEAYLVTEDDAKQAKKR